MQKKIIALAIAAAFSAPAFADTANVTVYGAVNMAVESISNSDDATGATSNGSATKISSNVSKIGFKGSEDLGDGLSAIWQIESAIDADNAASSGTTVNGFATRNTFVGLSDKAMGTVLLGKHDTPYKISTRALDAFADSIADNRTLMGAAGGTSFDGRQGNVIAYISPAMSGVTVAAAYVAGAEDAAQTANVTDKGAAYSMAAMYTGGDLYVAGAYEVHNFGTAGSGTVSSASVTAGSNEKAFKAGVGYKIADVNLSAVYENTNDNFGSGVGGADQNVNGHKAFYVAAKYALSATNTVKAAYGIRGATNAHVVDNDNDARQLSVGFDHMMGKRTSVFALYTKVTNGVASSTALTNGGSTGGNTTVTGRGADQSALAVGIKHAF